MLLRFRLFWFVLICFFFCGCGEDYGGFTEVEWFHSEICKRNVDSVEKMLLENPELVHYIQNPYSESAIIPGDTLQLYHSNTALHLAAGKGPKETVLLLLKYGAEVNSKDMNLYTPLHYAAINSNGECSKEEEMFKILLKSGSEINAKDKFGRTPLFYLSPEKEYYDVFKSHGADFSIKDNKGNTPLHFCVRYRPSWIHVPTWLVEFGSDVNAKNNKGQTSLDLAQKYNSRFVFEEIRYLGGKLNKEL